MEQYSLAKLQMAYLQVTLRNRSKEEEVCYLCYRSKHTCDCNADIQTDSFIQLTEGELQYA